MSKPTVAYYYDPEGSSYFFSPCHPMEPTRVNMTHELVMGYDLFSKMQIIGIDKATDETLKSIHNPEYIDSLKHTKPELTAYNSKNHKNTEDCPLFPGVYDYTASSVGGSISAAKYLNQGKADICIHWAGGMHHAKKGSASGFCYGNDIAAGILELLKYHKRVLYIDIDVHHGDGVEHMFYHTNRVMTLSFHQFGDFFPGTGQIEDRGVGTGKNYALNVPFKRGVDDLTYLSLFQPIVTKTIERYQPEAIVMQMGADSVVGDRLGQFNLSNIGHASCLKFVMKFQLPMIVLGGGGYTAYNVARTWALETGVILGEPLSDELPNNSYVGVSEGRGSLHIPSVEGIENLNSKAYLDSVYERVMFNLSQSEIAPPIRAEILVSESEHHVSSDESEEEETEEEVPEGYSDLAEQYSSSGSESDDSNTTCSPTSLTNSNRPLSSTSRSPNPMTQEEEDQLELLNQQLDAANDTEPLQPESSEPASEIYTNGNHHNRSKLTRSLSNSSMHSSKKAKSPPSDSSAPSNGEQVDWHETF